MASSITVLHICFITVTGKYNIDVSQNASATFDLPYCKDTAQLALFCSTVTIRKRYENEKKMERKQHENVPKANYYISIFSVQEMIALTSDLNDAMVW